MRSGAFPVALTIGLSVLLLIGGCRADLASIPETEIPEYAREHVRSTKFFGRPVSGVVWRVCTAQEDYQFIAAEYKGTDPTGTEVPMYLIAAFRGDELVYSVTRDLKKPVCGTSVGRSRP